MQKITTPFTDEQKEIVKYNWMRIAEDIVRKKRLNGFQNNLEKDAYFNLKDKDAIDDRPYTQEEKTQLEKMTKKISVALSHGYLLEEKELYDS